MVEAFIIAYNEAETIHLTLSHYFQFCDKITLYDNYSNDGTAYIAGSMGAEVKSFGTPGVLSDEDYLTVKNNCWKKSKADWVIVCDSDEIIWHQHLETEFKLQKEVGATIFKTIGWDVVSHDMPKDSFMDITNGYRNENYSKLAVFNPQAIKEIGYKYGCHVAKPSGNIVYADMSLLLMHYRNIGGPHRLVDRHAIYRPRMSEKNRRFGLGCHYEYTDEQRIKEWEEKYAGSVELCKAGLL